MPKILVIETRSATVQFSIPVAIPFSVEERFYELSGKGWSVADLDVDDESTTVDVRVEDARQVNSLASDVIASMQEVMAENDSDRAQKVAEFQAIAESLDWFVFSPVSFDDDALCIRLQSKREYERLLRGFKQKSFPVTGSPVDDEYCIEIDFDGGNDDEN